MVTDNNENIPPQSMDVTLMKLPQWIQRWRMKMMECAFLKLSSLNQLIVSQQFSMTLIRLIMPTIVVQHQKHTTIKIWFLLFIEGTHKTNNKTFPLFTVGICDENFKMNVILWVLCLNEWAQMFNGPGCSIGYSKRQFLLFLVLMHAKECVPSSPMVIHNIGDSQETSELDAAISMGI